MTLIPIMHWQQLDCLQKQPLFVLRMNFCNRLTINIGLEKPGFESPWGFTQRFVGRGSAWELEEGCPAF
jgi:hypothetical protein